MNNAKDKEIEIFDNTNENEKIIQQHIDNIEKDIAEIKSRIAAKQEYLKKLNDYYKTN